MDFVNNEAVTFSLMSNEVHTESTKRKAKFNLDRGEHKLEVEDEPGASWPRMHWGKHHLEVRVSGFSNRCKDRV